MVEAAGVEPAITLANKGFAGGTEHNRSTTPFLDYAAKSSNSSLTPLFFSSLAC